MQHSKCYHAKFAGMICGRITRSRKFSRRSLPFNDKQPLLCGAPLFGLRNAPKMPERRDNMHTAVAQNKPHFSIPSIIAVGAAIGSFFVRPGAGFALAIIAIIFGLFGLLLSFAPSIRGGLMSFFSLGLATIGIVVAIIKAIL